MIRSVFAGVVLVTLSLAGVADGSTITVSSSVRGYRADLGGGSYEVELGDTFWVDVYAHVTDNDYQTTPLGFSDLYLNLLSSGGTVGAVEPQPETGLGGPTGKVVMAWGTGFDDFNKIKALDSDLDADSDDDTKWASLSYPGSNPNAAGYSAATSKVLVATVTYEALALGQTPLMPQCDETSTRVWNFDGANFSKVVPQFAYEGVTMSVVPEPGCLSLLALGALAVIRRRKR